MEPLVEVLIVVILIAFFVGNVFISVDNAQKGEPAARSSAAAAILLVALILQVSW